MLGPLQNFFCIVLYCCPSKLHCLLRLRTSRCIICTGTCWTRRIFHGAHSAFLQSEPRTRPFQARDQRSARTYHWRCNVGSFQNCFLYVHITDVFENINFVSTLFRAFARAEHFAMGKSRRCYSKISSFCYYNRNRECNCVAFNRILSAYLQITIFEMSSRSVK